MKDTRIVDVNTSSPFHIAIIKITAAASNPITDIAVDIFSFLFLSYYFDLTEWFAVRIFPIKEMFIKEIDTFVDVVICLDNL